MAFRKLATYICHQSLRKNIIHNSNRPWHTSAIRYSLVYGKRDLETLDSYLQSEKNITDWDKFKVNVISAARGLNESNINSVILQNFIGNALFDQGKEFTKYLKNSVIELNLGTMGNILKFYYAYGLENDLTDDERQYIYDIYDSLNKNYPILDPITISSCIFGLSVTPKWKESVNLLRRLKENSGISSSIYNRIIIPAFDHGDIDVGWDLLHEMGINNKAPSDKIYSAWINYCLRTCKKSTLLKNIEKMLDYIVKYDLSINETTADLLKTVFSKIGWKGDSIKIGHKGKCLSCGHMLDEVVLNSNEYEQLQKAFYQKVLVGKNIYAKTSPKEINKFLEYLKKTGPYDMVIDGLNVMHSSGNKSPAEKSRILNAVIDQFLNEDKRVLILGRKHIRAMVQKRLNGPKAKDTGLFCTENLSYDDPFLLLAALNSPTCYFISRDFMRGHKFLLEDEKLQMLFKKWQHSRQYMLITVTKFGKVICQEPTKYLQVPQKNKGWHIPYVENLEKDYFTLPNWVCLQPQKNVDKTVIKK